VRKLVACRMSRRGTALRVSEQWVGEVTGGRIGLEANGSGGAGSWVGQVGRCGRVKACGVSVWPAQLSR
jgi:hypothetical protein